MTRPRRVPNEAGFTLIELLVVLLIIAILAAIAIPVYFAQREKAYVAQMQSALKNAAVAVETYAVEFNGDYAGLDGQDGSSLAPWGFIKPDWASPSPARFLIQADRTSYCLEARHVSLTANSTWRTSTFSSSNPVPVPVPDTCPNLVP